MINILNAYKGDVSINGTPLGEFNFKGCVSPLTIKLTPKSNKPLNEPSSVPTSVVEPSEAPKGIVKVSVRQYMTKKSSPEFDFMAKFNKDIPMPLRVMVGVIVKESPKMYYMELHGDILAERTRHCMKCGRVISNPVSQFFGLGPECGGHNYTNPFDNDEELKNAVASYKLELQKMTWTGWIPKSAIESMDVL